MVSFRFGPFRLIPDQRRLERDDAPVALTPKALDLLVALVRHRDRALSKDEILALVWPGVVIEEGNLAQQILLLRRALAEAGECVATIPRFGYRFVANVSEEREGGVGRGQSLHCIVWDGREFPLREGVTVIGRASHADVRIPLPSVSKQHARIVIRGLEATIEDLGSRHGTWRGAVALSGAVRLNGGDEIRLATARLTYCVVLSNDTTTG